MDTDCKRRGRAVACNDGTSFAYVIRKLFVVLLMLQSAMTFSVQPGFLNAPTLALGRRPLDLLLLVFRGMM